MSDDILVPSTAETWAQFAAAALQACILPSQISPATAAAQYADLLSTEFARRFGAQDPTPEAAQDAIAPLSAALIEIKTLEARERDAIHRLDLLRIISLLTHARGYLIVRKRERGEGDD